MTNHEIDMCVIAQKDARIAELEDQLAQAEELRKAHIAAAMEWHRKIHNCSPNGHIKAIQCSCDCCYVIKTALAKFKAGITPQTNTQEEKI